MNKIFIMPEDELRGLLYGRIYLLIRKNRWNRQASGAACGIIGGMLSIILGVLLWALVWVLPSGGFESSLYRLSNLFFFFTIPLLALGAFCLDQLEKMPPALPLPAKPQQRSYIERRRRLNTQRLPKTNHFSKPPAHSS